MDTVISFKALLVDDTEDFLYVSEKILEIQARDFKIVTCISAQQALIKLEEEEFDIVVSDFQMPGMNGLEFLKSLRDAGNEIPFIIFTGRSREEVAIQALNLGASYYLRKSGDSKSLFIDLVHHMRNAINNRKAKLLLLESESRYRSLFDNSSISLWEEDFSEVKKFIDVKKTEGITDFRDYFSNNPSAVDKCVELVRIIDVNKTSLEIHDLTDKSDLTGPLDRILTADALNVFKEELISLANGHSKFKSDIQLVRDVHGCTHAFIFQIDVPPGYEDTLSKVYLSITDMTENYESEIRAARESKMAQTYFELSSVMFVALDVQANIMSVNSHTCKLLEFEEEELIGRNWFDLVIPANLISEVKNVFNEIISGRLHNADYYENPIQTKSGELRFIAWHNAIMHDDSGNIIGILSSGHDITNKKKLDEALAESEKLHREAQALAKTGHWRFDLDTDRIFWSDQLYSIYEIDKATGPITSSQFFDLIHPEDQAIIKDQLERREPVRTDYRIIMKDGSIKYIHEEVIIEYDEKGRIKGMRGTAQDVTKVKLSEKALSYSEERFRLFFNNAPILFYIVSPEGEIIDVNQEVVNVLGYSKEELVNQPVSMLYAPEVLPKMKNLFQIWKETGRINRVETVIVAKNGEYRDVILLVDAHRNSEGELVHSVSVQVDITDSKRVQEQLKHSQALLNTVIGQAPIPMLLANADGKLEIINEACKKQIEAEHRPSFKRGTIHGELERPQRIFDSAGNEIPFEDRALSRALRGERTVSEEYRIIRVDGTERWERVDGLPIHDDDGNIIGGLVVFPDITERKRVEQALIQSEEILRLVIGSMKEAILVIDRDRKVKFCNKAFEEMWEIPEEIAKKKDYGLLIESVLNRIPDPKSYLEQMEKLLQSSEEVFESYNLSDGRTIIRYTYPLVTNNEINGRTCLFRDVTDEVTINEKIKQEREALSDFAHRMQHELRNKLVSISAYASLLEKDQNQEYIYAIERLVKNITEFLDQSVLLADAGMIIGEMAPNSLDEIVESIISDMYIPELQFEKDVLPSITCNKLKISQVFQCLFQNAIEHGKAKKIEVRLQNDDDGKFILIKNDGEPIVDEHHEYIFKEGFSTKQGGGMGLGIVKRIIEAHDWTITLDKGGLTCFRIFIPSAL